MAFRGQFDHTLDAKKRLNVPARFRAAFAEGVVLQKALEPCIALWAPAAFERFTDSFLRELNPLSAERRKLSRYFAGHSWDAELDSSGRITLGQTLLEHAGIDRDVIVVGNIDRVELWDPERWRGDQESLASDVVEIAESLGHPS